MKFIITQDWDMQIRSNVLSAVKNSEAALNDAIDTAVAELQSYLRNKYDVAKVFAPIIAFDNSRSYPKDTRLFDAGSQKMYVVIATNSTAGLAITDTSQFTQADTRHPLLLTYCKDIALYHIHTNISPQNIPQLRKDRYDQAISWLNKVNKDMLSLDLPLLDANNPSASFRLGSKSKYSDRW